MEKRDFTILVIDDDPADVELLRRLLGEIEGWKIKLFACNDAGTGRADALRSRVDLIFLDYLLGAETGLELLYAIRGDGCFLPVIMLTGHGSEEVAVEAMKAGVSDYLVKGRITPDRLCLVISNALRKFEVQQKIEEQRKALLDAERKRVEEALRKSEGVYRTHLDVEPILDRVLQGALELTGMEGGTLCLLDRERQTLRLAAAYNASPEMVKDLSLQGIKIGDCLCGQVAKTGAPFILCDNASGSEYATLESVRKEGMRFHAAFPLLAQDQTIGVLCIFARSEVKPTLSSLELVKSICGPIALAIENARLFRAISQHREELRDMTIRLEDAEEAVRRRLARELHDRVGQNLTALSLDLGIIHSQLSAESSGEIVFRLEDSLRLLEDTARQIRDVMAELRPPVLDDYGLPAALQWYGEQFAKRTGVRFVIQGAGSTPRLPPRLEMALFRITQEALTNVARHARARQVTVRLIEEVAQTIQLIIADDGTGFDHSGTRPGWGLIHMRERAEAVGGYFEVKSPPGEETRIMVAVRK